MIKLAGEGDRKELLDFCASFPLGVRLSCCVLAYGLEGKVFSAHIQLDGEGKIVAAIGNLGGNGTLLCADEAGFEELSLFFSFGSFRTVTGDVSSFEKLKILPFERKKLFRFEGKAVKSEEVKNDGDLRKMYGLVCAGIPDSFEDGEENFLEFLSDFTYRRNRDLARLKIIENGGEVFASCLTVAEDEKRALIGAVVSSPAHRGEGLGKKVVLSMARDLTEQGKTAYVIALNEKAEGFYEHIGFKYIGDICQYKG